MMTIKTLLGLASGKQNKVNKGGNWTFGWSPSQASALSGNGKQAKRSTASSDRAVGMYGVLATRSGNGR
ncbi:hypothetical protein [Collimonas pratensis]|uniref:Uncharacterized protein n=1 Tax=Collimonas pratensis TaxID=279113 RepID=A0A127Q9A5_9BURK|nr:hypothetical protein [Collimonas pratensis]AMP06649.1 hypothetical protein CPter91_4339 [Collimonas pratensis]